MAELKLVYSLSIIMTKAWGISRHLAKHQGGSPRLHFAQALRQSWAAAKAAARRIAEERERVLACVAQLKADRAPLAVARRERHMAAFRAECQVAADRATAMARALTRPAVRRAA